MGDTSEDVTRILVQLDTIQEDMLITQALYVNDLFLLILLRAVQPRKMMAMMASFSEFRLCENRHSRRSLN